MEKFLLISFTSLSKNLNDSDILLAAFFSAQAGIEKEPRGFILFPAGRKFVVLGDK